MAASGFRLRRSLFRRVWKDVGSCLSKTLATGIKKMEELRDDLRGCCRKFPRRTRPASLTRLWSGTGAAPGWGESGIESYEMAQVAQCKDTVTSAPGHGTPTKPTIHETPFTTIADQQKKSLAILCFRNLSNDPASSFYEFSLADAVITELARVRSLVVRPSSVIAKYRVDK